ncbi:hypothetical protein [Undibacterium sp. Ji22W]
MNQFAGDVLTDQIIVPTRWYPLWSRLHVTKLVAELARLGHELHPWK